jgi:hypothetical protein
VCGVPDMNFSGKCFQYEMRYRTGHTLLMESVLNYQRIAVQLMKFVANVWFPRLES